MGILLYEVADSVCTITLNRPEVLNALDPALINALDEAVQRAAADAEARVVVLTGAGRGFCSGGDVRGVGIDGDVPNTDRKIPPRGRSAAQLLHDMPKPTIAMINGPAAGAGIGLAGACDLRIAAESATFLAAFARWGLAGDYGATYYWTKILGVGKTRALFMLNEKLDARQALEFGVVHKVAPDGGLKAEVEALAARLAKTPARGWSLMKDSLNKAEHLAITDALENELNNMTLSSQARAERRRTDGGA
ncbi:MAG: enoyl-CoA hydratase/isomerase family protein [Caulobacteraceae bacterium]|nr:enoyl-CoA hydratase/isomerase family protein [Caulobacteraceae bacterium]